MGTYKNFSIYIHDRQVSGGKNDEQGFNLQANISTLTFFSRNKKMHESQPWQVNRRIGIKLFLSPFVMKIPLKMEISTINILPTSTPGYLQTKMIAQKVN